jgi:long-chain acyl-CoA synthetase
MNSQPWLATYREYGIAEQIDTAGCTSVVQLLEGAMRRHANRIAFRAYGHALSYAAVDRLSGAFAAWLQHELGVRKGERVALMLPNVLAFPLACLGLARAGAVQVNVNPMYTARELAHQLNDAGCSIIIVFDGATATLADALADTPVKTVVTVGLVDGAADSLSDAAVDARLGRTHRFTDALRAGAALERQPVALGPDDLLFLQYTGGTTGLSKGAALSHGNLVANTAQFRAQMAGALKEGEEVVVTAIPLYHIFALMVNFITCFSVGAENWLVANPRDMDELIDILKQSHLTVFSGVNTLYGGLARHPRIGEVDFSHLRLAVGGGAPVLQATSDQWQALTGRPICQGYGLSETSPVVSFNPLAMSDFNGTTGLPVPGTDVQLRDDNGVPVAPGEAGEICVKGPQVMRGYWQQPEANAAAFTADGYFRTGDMGTIDARGLLRIVDRKKDMVLVSGFNVFPGEIEAVAAGLAGVAECACIGVPDERTGEAVKLFVVAVPGVQLSAEQVIAHCRTQLTAYKVPRLVQFVEALPKSTVGKILRRTLRG